MKCKFCSEEFNIEPDERKLQAQVSPAIDSKLLLLQDPHHCPDCRRLIRLSFRNDQNYYRNKCDNCGTSLIAIYSEDKQFPVLCTECFWSDAWDPLSHGVKYDPNRDFLEQFAQMRSKLPRIAIYNTLSQNCDYTVHCSHNKDCYLCSSTIDCEGCQYCDMVFRSKDSLDCHHCADCELCYDCAHCNTCFDCEHLQHCDTCSECSYCHDCRGGQYLLGCVGLRQKKLMVLNKSVTQEQYETLLRRIKSEVDFSARFKKNFFQLVQKASKPGFWNQACEDCRGNYLSFSKELNDCFEVGESETGRYLVGASRVTNCMDCSRCGNCEMLYNCHGAIDLKNSICCNLCYQCDNLIYCDNCQGGASRSLGCFGLKKHKYCVLNKQYSKTDYENLALEIAESMIEQGTWGNFFDPSLSPFGYNESRAAEAEPFSREQVLELGWNWSDYEPTTPKGVDFVEPKIVLGPIADVDDDILKQVIQCEACKKPFRITQTELKFYRLKNIPLPRLCPADRHKKRCEDLLPCQVFRRQCQGCARQIDTSYPPNDSRKVYCERCYLEETH